MTDHLPECIYQPPNVDPGKGIKWGGSPCICDRLRACEQRVLAAAREAVAAKALHSPKCWALLPAFNERDCNCACAYALAAIDALKEKP